MFFISIDSNPLDSIPNFLKKNKIDFHISIPIKNEDI